MLLFLFPSFSHSLLETLNTIHCTMPSSRSCLPMSCHMYIRFYISFYVSFHILYIHCYSKQTKPKFKNLHTLRFFLRSIWNAFVQVFFKPNQLEMWFRINKKSIFVWTASSLPNTFGKYCAFISECYNKLVLPTATQFTAKCHTTISFTVHWSFKNKIIELYRFGMVQINWKK